MRQPSKELVQYVANEVLRVSQDLQQYSNDYAMQNLNVKDKELYIDEMIENIAERAQSAAENIIRKVRLSERKGKKTRKKD